MKKPFATFGGVIGILFAAALVPVLGAGPPHSGDPALDRAIARANSEWAEAMKTGDVASILKPYLPDAVFTGADGGSLQGITEIGAFYRERFQKNGLASSTRIEPRHVERDGDLAYESGYGEMTFTKEGKPVTAGGRYLTVWQKQPDGNWKIRRNVILP